MDAALDLLRRLKPQEVSSNLSTIIDAVPDIAEDLLSSVDQPLKIKRCKVSNKDYLLCDYNRDQDSYRSPWSNEFDPPIKDGVMPSKKVRAIEITANDAFDTYRDLYYEGGLSSVYLWDLDDGFAGVVLLKKTIQASKSENGWDSIHVFEALDRGRISTYKLTSTIILNITSESAQSGKIDLGGNLTRQIEQDMDVKEDNDHVCNIGRLVEEMEFKMRNQLQEIYFGKTKDICNE